MENFGTILDATKYVYTHKSQPVQFKVLAKSTK